MSSSAVDELLLSLGLPASTCPQYEYHGVDDFASVLDNEYKLFATDNTRSQYIAFRGLTKSLFDRDFLYPESSVLTFESYFPKLALLLVKMEFKPHTTAAWTFGNILMEYLDHMNGDNLDQKLTPIGTAHFWTIDRTKRLGKSCNRRWPSLIVEVGFSESYQKPQEDAKWWLTDSNNEVKTAVLISINRMYREIVIEKWILDQGQPIKDYRTVLSQAAGTKNIQISNAQPFIIPFNQLFLRRAESNEHDIILDNEAWEYVAGKVWEVQFETDYTQMA